MRLLPGQLGHEENPDRWKGPGDPGSSLVALAEDKLLCPGFCLS